MFRAEKRIVRRDEPPPAVEETWEEKRGETSKSEQQKGANGEKKAPKPKMSEVGGWQTSGDREARNPVEKEGPKPRNLF